MRKALSVIMLILLCLLTLPMPSKPRVSAADSAYGKTLLYVPLDNRPVNFEYVSLLVNISNEANLLMPPSDLLNRGEDFTDPRPVWEWIFTNLERADAVVISLDTIFFGGLVPSRKHRMDADELDGYMSNLKRLTGKAKVPVYVFGTIMRSQLPKGEAEYHSIDLKDRRRKNIGMIERAVSLTAMGYIDYLVVGLDDTRSYAKADRDFNRLSRAISNANSSVSHIQIFHGADELGALLTAKALNVLSGSVPNIYFSPASSREAKTINLYEDRPPTSSISARVKALGGRLVNNLDEAGIVLIVNSAQNGATEASAQVNKAPTEYHHDLAEKISLHASSGRSVALADIAYANGGDDALMTLLADKGLLSELAAYSGWNTASNSIGTSLAAGSIYYLQNERGSLDSASHSRALMTRLIEDWGYQATVRPRILQKYGLSHSCLQIPTYIEDAVLLDLKEGLNAFVAVELTGNLPRAYLSNISTPWNRLFDISFYLELAG